MDKNNNINKCFEKWVCQGWGGAGKVDKILCNIKTLFEAFFAVLDTFQVVFSPNIVIAKNLRNISFKKFILISL